MSSCMAQKKLMRITTLSSSDCFELCPLLLNRIQVRTVGREELHRMPLCFNSCDDVRSFVEWRSIQYDNRRRRYGEQQCSSHPCQKDIRIDVAIPQLHCKKCEAEHCSDGIQSSFCMPVMFSMASTSSAGISMCSWRIHREATFIQIHNGAFLDLFVPAYLRLKL